MKVSGLKYLAKQGVENIWKNRMMSLKCSLIPIFREAMCTSPTYV